MFVVFKYIATLGFIGYLPIAQGTVGSLIACILFIVLKPSLYAHIIIICLIVPVSIVASHYAEILLNEKDSRHIVIDEFCGYFLSVLFLPYSINYAVSAFLLFRIFDILKPFPIKKIEGFRRGLGIVADDLMAALYANLILQAWKVLHSVV